jgi:DNA-binding CsgD family transcriptional regulator
VSSLLERDSEMWELGQALSSTEAGEGAVVVVVGGPGLGKTRLIEAAGRLAEPKGLRVLRARGAELETTFPFGVVRQVLEPPLAGLPPDERAAVFEGAAALARPLFEGAEPLPRNGARFAALSGLYWLVVHIADRGPLLLLVDDAHRADPASLQFLEYLARRVSGLPLALVVAARTGEPGEPGDSVEGLALNAGAQVLRPRPLTEEGVAALTAERLAREPDPAFARACREATGGNPLFLEELLRELEAQAIEPAATAAPLVREVGPDAVARLARSRLELVGPEAVELARATAVLGDGAELSLAAAIAGLGADEARATADRLSEAEILARSLRLGFVHPIVRAAIYGHLAPGERAARHAAAAKLLQDRVGSPDRVAAHLLLSDPAGDPRRVKALVDAARLALARGVPENAATYLRRALEEPPPKHDRPGLLLEAGQAEYAAQQFAPSEEHLRAALAAGDEEMRIEAVRWLGRTLSAGGRAEECIALLESELARAADRASPAAFELENELLLATRLSPAHRARSAGRAEDFRRRAAGRPRFEALALLHLAHERLCDGATAAEVGELAERALALCPPGQDEPSFFWAVRTLLDAERDEAAARALDLPLDGVHVGRRLWRGPVVALHRAELEYTRGALAEAATEADVGVAAIEAAGGFHMALPRLQAVRLDVLRERGELDEADEALERAGPAHGAADLPPYARLLWSRGLLRLDQGRLEEARDDFVRCGQLRRALGGGRIVHPDWRARCAVALARLGEQGEAEALAAEQLELARAFGAPRALGEALRAAALVRGGLDALALLDEAVAVLAGARAPLALAHALADQGGALREAGRRRESREPLGRALKLAERCGAAALARHARAALSAGGGRPPPTELTGVAALTPAERRVAALAVDGLTNRGIAQALFVTEKTVEIHLRNAYRKLGIRTRWQLPERLGEAEAERLVEVG